MLKAKQIDMRTTPARSSRKGWIITAVALFALAAAGSWMLMPQKHATASDSQGLLAKAPPAANPRPLNADGAPVSD
jgi:hypothetical protein